MAHLLTPRKGWENEKLASYLLSRFSFVAQPTSVADDLGSDFFCTIFEIHDSSGTDVLVPRSSFAIQVKSSMSEVSMDNKIDYLDRLQMPFFIGVVTQSPGVMRVYSAELTLRARLVGADEDSGPAIRNFRCRAEEDLRAGGNSYARPWALGKKDGWKEYVASGAPRASAWYGR
jgi:hypothetical protein